MAKITTYDTDDYAFIDDARITEWLTPDSKLWLIGECERMLKSGRAVALAYKDGMYALFYTDGFYTHQSGRMKWNAMDVFTRVRK